MTRGLARDFGPRGITVNNVQPGPIATDMNPEDGRIRRFAARSDGDRPHGQPREVASVVSYLAGPESGYVTGANWNVDGGFTV